MNQFSPQTTSSDESGINAPSPPHLAQSFPPDKPFMRSAREPSHSFVKLPAEEVACSFYQEHWGADVAPETLNSTLDLSSPLEQSPSHWIRSASAASSHSSIMDLSKMVFSGLDEDDSAFLLPDNEVDPLSTTPLADPVKEKQACSPLVPSVTQIWSNSQRRLESLLSRVIDRDNSSSAMSLSSLDAENQSTPSSLADHVPKVPSLPPGRLEGLLSKALDSAVSSSRSHSSVYNSPPSALGNLAPPSRHVCHPPSAPPGILAPNVPVFVGALPGTSNKRIKIEEVPAFSGPHFSTSTGDMLPPRLAPGHVAPNSKKIGNLQTFQGGFSHAGPQGDGPWASGIAAQPLPCSASMPGHVAGRKTSGSDEEDPSGGEEGSAFPKSWSTDPSHLDNQSGVKKRGHVGKKRVASERNRRGKIREGLHQLREVIRGQNDYAATLLEAVSYIRALEEQVRELKAKVRDDEGDGK